MSSLGCAIYVVISISYIVFFGRLREVFIALYILPPMSVSDRGLPCRLCAFRPLLVATLKTEGKSIGCDFFEKNSLFFHPYIGIPAA